MVVAIVEGLKGARTELSLCPDNLARLQCLARIIRVIASEIGDTILLAPYGWRAASLHRRLPTLGSKSTPGVRLAKDVRYGPRPRNTMDIYIPPGVMHGADQPAGTPVPVALFTHGGVWVGGEKWHYAPMATCLAQEGVITCVLAYSLYPQAHAPVMVSEVSAALTWVLDHVSRFGGDPARVTLMGHSAGAQLSAMALLQRVANRQRTSKDGRDVPATLSDQRMPARFVGMAGVYDIAKHYEHETMRGVQYLSTMARAMGGRPYFESQSPACILARALQGATGAAPEPQVDSYYGSFQLHGDAIAHRIGHGLVSLPPSRSLVKPLTRSSANAFAEAEVEDGRRVDLATVQRLPPFILMSSCDDLVVPWYESGEMHVRLRDCGVPSKHLMYRKVGHGGFVVDWRLHGSVAGLPISRAKPENLDNFQHDLLSVLRGDPEAKPEPS